MNETEEFLHRYGEKSFRHCEELITNIRLGKAILRSHTDPKRMGVPAERLLDTYNRREKHMYEVGTLQGLELREDILPFCAELSKVPGEAVALWQFIVPPDVRFTVFEGLHSQRILGCFRRVEERVVKKAEPSAV